MGPLHPFAFIEEKYMRKLGGGGHKTDAACQIQEKKPKKVEKNLIKKLGK